jgi:hypothetical protein
VFARAREDGITPVEAADRIAEERRDAIRRMGPPYLARQS